MTTTLTRLHDILERIGLQSQCSEEERRHLLAASGCDRRVARRLLFLRALHRMGYKNEYAITAKEQRRLSFARYLFVQGKMGEGWQ